MDLIYEKDDFPLGTGHFVYHGFQPFLEFTFVFGSGDQGTHVEREYLLVAQILRHVATHDPVSQALGYGRLAHPRPTDKDRIVLGASRENLQHSPDLVIATDHGIQLAIASTLTEIDGIFLQCIVLFLRTLTGHVAPLPKLFDGRLQKLFGGSGILEQSGRLASRSQNSQHDVLQRDVFVLHPVRCVLRCL